MNWIRFTGYLFILLVALLLLEILSFSSINFLQQKYNSLIFDPKLIVNFKASESDNYSNDLGWIIPKAERDEIGARLNNDIYKTTCVDMFGDSFTFSAEVKKEFAWPKQLSTILGCKVNNFGVKGYGSDQAVLRHELTIAFSKVSVLNHLSENIIRNVNQFRNLIYPSRNSKIITKPRYYLTPDEKLILIKKPDLLEEDLKNLENLRSKLKYEYFLPEAQSGIKMDIKFPYFLSAIDLVIHHFHIRPKIKGQTRHSEFYDYSHPSNGLPLTNKIFDKFISNSDNKGQIPIITIIPTCRDLEEFKRYGKLPYQVMLDSLRSKGILFYDFSSAFLNEQDFYKYFSSCSGHPNKDGYALMAKNFANFLSKHKKILAIHIPKIYDLSS